MVGSEKRNSSAGGMNGYEFVFQVRFMSESYPFIPPGLVLKRVFDFQCSSICNPLFGDCLGDNIIFTSMFIQQVSTSPLPTHTTLTLDFILETSMKGLVESVAGIKCYGSHVGEKL